MENKDRLVVGMDELVPIFKEQLSQGKSICFSPKGISMLPMLRQGKDTVTLSLPSQKLKKYDIPLYQRDDGKYILHRIVSAGDDYTCIGDNQFTYEYGIRPEQIIAVVTSFSRGKKEHAVNTLTYKIYCRLWHYSRPLRHFWRRVWGKLKRTFFR